MLDRTDTGETVAGLREAEHRAARLIAAADYPRWIDLRVVPTGGELVFRMPFRDELIGNPYIRAIHGGAMAMLLENAAAVTAAVAARQDELPDVLTATYTYLRPTGPHDSHAVAQIERLGRRVISIHAQAWQLDRSKPTTTAKLIISGGG